MNVGANRAPAAGSRQGVVAIGAGSGRRDERGLLPRLIVAFVDHDLQLLRNGSKEPLCLSVSSKRMAELWSLTVREKTPRQKIFAGSLRLCRLGYAWSSEENNETRHNEDRASDFKRCHKTIEK